MKKIFLTILVVLFSGAALATASCPYTYYDRHGKLDQELQQICSDLVSGLSSNMHSYCTGNQIGSGKGTNGCVDQQLLSGIARASSDNFGVSSQQNVSNMLGGRAQNSRSSSSSNSSSGNIFQ
ncbi:MAG: hypothetical protein JXR42_03980 [Gammaproteobacteria bacterium]|nr:hypothetical protein [Gammaproteobacteria bacterium]